jgi:hypothetical protein
VNINFTNKVLNSFLLFFLISSYWALLIKNNLVSENFLSSVKYLYLYIYLIIFLQISLALFLFKFIKSYNLLIFFLTIFLFYNFYSLSISLSSDFISLVRIEKIKLFLIYLFFSVAAFLFLFKLEKVKKVIILIYIFLNIFALFNPNISFKNDIEILKYNFENTEIKKKFNIYIFTIESLFPQSIASNHLNLENLSYINALKENKFLIFKNHFSDNYPTRPSLDSLLFIDPDKWRSLKKNNSFFAGRYDTPLFNFFRKNNYKVITGYFDSHFGAPGPYVDEYLTFRSVENKNKFFSEIYINFCQFKLPWYHLQLFNYCDVLKNIFEINKQDILSSKNQFNLSVIDRVINKEKKIVFIHFYTFGHPSGETINYVDDVKQGDLETTEIIQKTINKIKEKDPNSVLILMGDSGPTILKTSDEINLTNKIYKMYPNKEHAKIIDGHATLGSIFDNNDNCKEWTSKLLNYRFTSNSMIFNKILACMTMLDDIMMDSSIKIEYKLPQSKNFINYLYE